MQLRRSDKNIPYFLVVLSVALLWVPSSQSQETFAACTICKDGTAMGNPDGILTTSTGQTTSCSELAEYAVHLPERSCQNLQWLALVPCECPGFDMIDTTDVGDTVRAEEDGGGAFICSICRDGEMTNPTGLALDSAGRPTTCQALHDDRENIAESACGIVQSLARTPCGCTDSQALNVTSAGTEVNSTVCSICGEGGRMENPNGVVVNNRGQARSCSALAASVETIPEGACASLQAMAWESCGCTTPGFDEEETTGEIPFLCSICGDGSVMTNPQGSVSPQSGEFIQCGALEANANSIPQRSCATLQVLAQEACGCTALEVTGQAILNSTDNNNITIGEDTIPYQCPICGGGEMTIPQGIVTSRQGNSARCDVLVSNAHTIPETACSNVQALAKDPCGCILPINTNTSMTNDLNNDSEICKICGEGEMTIRSGIVTTPQGQSARCGAIEANAASVPMDRCPSIQSLASEPCGCTSIIVNETGTVSETVEFDDGSVVCDVCGEGRQVSRVGKMITTSLGVFTCASAQSAGLRGMIPADHCDSVSISVVQDCGCYAEGPTVAPSPSPYYCSICGEGMIVTRPDVIMNVAGVTQNATCGQYEAAAMNGNVNVDQCPGLQEAAVQVCGCKDPPPVPTEAPTSYQCPICGEGRTIGLPNAEVVLPNTQRMSCSGLQQRSEMGIIPETQCTQIQPFVKESCGCIDVASVAVTPTESPTPFKCNICGEGLRVTSPDGVVVIPTQPDRTCAQLLAAATIGNINPNQCQLLHPFVFTPCGCTDEYSETPSDSPSLSPTAPTVSPGPTSIKMREDCFADLGEIYSLERNVQNTTTARKYVLCPDVTFQMGVWTEDAEIKEGEPFLALRPNVVYQCGEDGSRMNNCVLKGGDFGVASYYGVFDGIYEVVSGVEIRGLTFESQNLFSVLLQAAGDISFIGCAFKGNNNNAPVLIQWGGEGPEDVTASFERALEVSPSNRKLQDSNLKHVVTFQDCVFRDNFVDRSMSFPGIIENSFNSDLIISNCLFQDNVYGEEENPATYGYAIRSFGPLTLESSCFLDNTFFNHGPVLIYGTQYSASNNYVQSSQADLTCEFLALFNSQDDVSEDPPTCELSDADICAFSQAPTVAPTQGEVTTPPSQEYRESEGSSKPTAATVASTPENIGTQSSAAAAVSLSPRVVVALVSLLSLVGPALAANIHL